MPDKKTSRKNMLFILTLGIVFCALLLFSIFEIIHINQSKVGIEREEQAYMENQGKLIQLKQLSKKEDELIKNQSVMNYLIPDSPDEAQLISEIQSVADEYSVNFVKIQFDDRVVNNNINVMPISLSLSGDYKGLIQFIGGLSSGERLIRIDEVNISKNEQENQIVIIAEIKAKAFFR